MNLFTGLARTLESRRNQNASLNFAHWVPLFEAKHLTLNDSPGKHAFIPQA